MAAVVRMKGEISVNSNTGLVGPWKLEKSVTFGAAASNAPVTLNAGGFIVMQDISTVEISISNSSGNTANISISCGGT